MADSSVTQTIFFIASVIVAASLAGVFIGISQDMAGSIKGEADRVSEMADSNFAILNDPAMVPYSNGTLTIYLKNLSTRIMGQSMDVFVDGQLCANCTASVEGGGSGWPPGAVLTKSVGLSLAPGDHELKVVLTNGVSEELRFRI